MEVDSVGIIAILSMSHITKRISKNTDKCGKNPQSARRKPIYHTRCGKNCHKIRPVHVSENVIVDCVYFFTFLQIFIYFSLIVYKKNEFVIKRCKKCEWPIVKKKLNFLKKFHNITFYYSIDYVSMFIFNFSHNVENCGLT